jgi:hypothetical protein
MKGLGKGGSFRNCKNIDETFSNLKSHIYLKDSAITPLKIILKQTYFVCLIKSPEKN